MFNVKKSHTMANSTCEMYYNSNFGYPMSDYYYNSETTNPSQKIQTGPLESYNLNRNFYNNYYNYNQHVQAYSECFLNDANIYSNSQVVSPECLQQYQFVNQPHRTSSPFVTHSQIITNHNYCDFDSGLNSSSRECLNSTPLSGVSTNTVKNSKLTEISPMTESNSKPIINEIDMKTEKYQEKKCKKRGRVIANHHQLPEIAIITLNTWFESHISHPYPTATEKHRLADESGISLKQVNSWFCNRRNRSQNTKPKRIKRHLAQEISNVFNELVKNPNKNQVIEKFRNTLIMHDIGVGK